MSKSIKMITRNRTSGPKPIDPYHSNKTTGSVGSSRNSRYISRRAGGSGKNLFMFQPNNNNTVTEINTSSSTVNVDENSDPSVLTNNYIFPGFDEMENPLLEVMSNNTNLVTATIGDDGVTLTYVADVNGNATIVITLSTQTQKSTHTVSVSVSPSAGASAPAVANAYPDIQVNEDGDPKVINLSNVFTYTQSETLTFTASSSNPQLVAVEIDGTDLTLTFGENAHGSANVTMEALDPSISSSKSTDTFKVTVISIDDQALGDVTISGTVQQGAIITAYISDINDVDGPLSFAYQWQSSSDNSSFSNIANATSNAYPIPDDQSMVNKYIRVTVTTLDDTGGSSIKISTSQQVTNVNDAPTVTNAISDVIVVEDSGSTTIELSNVFSDIDSDTLALSVASSNTDLVTASIDGTTLTLTYVANANGNTTVVVTATETGTSQARSVSDTFNVSVSAQNDAPSVKNVISDVTVIEDASPTTIELSNVFSDIESDDLTLTAVSNNTNLVTVGIVGTTLTLTYMANAFGNTTIVATATEKGTSPASASDTFIVTIHPVDDEASGNVTISGIVEEGASISANVSDIADDDSDVLSFTYQWQSSSDDTSFNNIDGATSSTYAIPFDQTFVDKFIRVEVVSTDSTGGISTKFSTSQQVANVDDEASGDVTISGTVQEGESITAYISDINDDDGVLTFAYQWQSSIDNSSFSNIADATANTYAIPNGQSMVDKFIRVQVITTDSTGGISTKFSTSQQVANVDDEASGDVTIFGTVRQGASISADVTGIADDDDGVLTFAYQWQYSSTNTDNSLFSNIADATANTYAIPNDQSMVDKFIRVQVITTDSRGGTSTKFSIAQQVINVNDKPTINNSIVDVIVSEGSSPTTIDLSNVFSDIDSDTLALNVVSSNTDLVTAAIDGTTLTLTYVANAIGNTTVVVTATETGTNPALSESDTFSVTITPPTLNLTFEHTSDFSVTLPLLGDSNDFVYSVYWGDGTTSNNELSHTYTSGENTYTAKLMIHSGSVERFGNHVDTTWVGHQYLTEVSTSSLTDWALPGIKSLKHAFYKCEKLVKVPKYLPNTVTNLGGTFSDATIFNYDITNWDTENVVQFSYMFYRAVNFEQDIRVWNVNSVTMDRHFEYMFTGATKMLDTYSAPPSNTVTSAYFYQTLSLKFEDTSDFIVTLPLLGDNNDPLDYIVYWGDGTTSNNELTHTYTSGENTYTAKLVIHSGSVERFGNYYTTWVGHQNLTEVSTSSLTDWALPGIKSLKHAFYKCEKLVKVPKYLPNTVTNLGGTFSDATIFNYDITNWDTENVVQFSYMFYRAVNFEQDIRVWNVSGVTQYRPFEYMFAGATKMIDTYSAPPSNNVTSEYFTTTG